MFVRSNPVQPGVRSFPFGGGRGTNMVRQEVNEMPGNTTFKWVWYLIFVLGVVALHLVKLLVQIVFEFTL